MPNCIGKPGQPLEYKDGFLHSPQAQDISPPHIPAEVFRPCGEALGPTSLVMMWRGDGELEGWGHRRMMTAHHPQIWQHKHKLKEAGCATEIEST